MARFDTIGDVEKPQKAIIYGPPKTGKTEVIARMVEAGYKLIWFDLENGYQTIRTRIDRKYWPQIELIRLPDTRENPCGYTIAARAMTLKPVRYCSAHAKVACLECTKAMTDAQKAAPAVPVPDLFETVDLSSVGTDTIVVFDSLTQASTSAMNIATKALPDVLSLEFKHYKAQGMHLDAFLTAIQQAPFHICVTSHETEIEQTDGKPVIGPVGGTANFSRNVSKYFDHVIYTSKVNKDFKTASSAGFHAKVIAGSRSDIALEDGKSTLVDLFRAVKPQ